MIEKLYERLQEENLGMEIMCDRTKIEIANSNTKIMIITRNLSPIDVKIGVHKKCSFTNYFSKEHDLAWHIKDDTDMDGLVDRIKKLIKQNANDKGGPYGFSKRSTYIKRHNNTVMAMSGNFVNEAIVEGMVTMGKDGRLNMDILDPKSEPWYLIVTNANKKSYPITNDYIEILYNLEQWWPVDIKTPLRSQRYATSVLSKTNGRLLTMHDKFVIDLAVKLFGENPGQKY